MCVSVVRLLLAREPLLEQEVWLLKTFPPIGFGLVILHVILKTEQNENSNSDTYYQTRTRREVLVNERKAFYNKCVAKGVDMDFSHCSIGCPVEFEREHDIAGKVLNLPFYYNMTDQELKKVVSVVNSIK